MSRHATDFQEEGVPSPPLPADHVLSSAAVLFPGAFDQHGCPLIVFPVDEQAKLSSELSKAEVVDFVNYFLCLHNKKQEKQSLVSVVADLKHASLLTTRVIAETLLLLELHKRTVHSVYIIQPKKKDVVRLLLKILAPSKSYTASFKKVLLKEISELSNYIDRSQLTASLGGYLIYCHHSWVAFIKEIDEFVQEFLSVVQRLPSCISTLQALSRLAMPSTFSELQRFCSTNEAKFQQLRRELGLDELLSHCESVVEKLRHPEKEPCYQAMAGTALFTHTAFDMLRNHSRITAAVEKVELLWQQAFSKARLQLQVFQLREDALQITEEIKTLLQDKLQPYKIRIAKDAAKAAMLLSEFEASVHTPAMALIRCAEDVIHTVAEILLVDGQTGERWVLDLERLKEKLHSAVLFILQTLRAVSNYHHHYNKANSWYSRVLCENVLQVLLSGVNADPGGPTLRQRRNRGTVPAWRYKVSTFLKNNPPPDVEALLHLAHLSNAIPDDEVREVGKQMSQRCMTLRKLLIGLGPVAVGHLQLALQWQYDFLRSSHVNRPSVDGATNGAAKVVQDPGKCESVKEAARLPRTSPSTAVSGTASAEAKPSSLSSFDSGFDGAGSSQLEAWGGRDGVDGLSRLAGSRDSARPATTSQTLKENISSVSDCEDHREEFDVGSVGNSSRSSIQIIPKVTVDSLNVEIKVKRSAALPNNPWLSLPVDDLEKSYTVTITQNPTPQKRNLRDPSDPRTSAESNGSRDQRTQMEVLDSAQARRPQSRDSRLHSQSTLEDPELSPIRNVLSSTITDGRDESVCTTEGIPTLLWDSYDLHDQNQETVDSAMDLSLNDWDVKEQEGLREVEKILDRADEILEKEENVLAQEAVLDALLRSEDGHNQWPLWASEHQLGAMSSSELAEAGVLGLEDDLDPAEFDLLSEPRTGSASETKASEEDDGHCTEAATEAEAFRSRSDLLTELRNVCVLDELIREENLKIHELRSCKEKISREELSAGKPPSDTNVASSTSKEREAFRLQLEKEKREVEKLEKSLDKERNAKKRKDGARRVVKCSIMERARSESQEDQALCDALLSGNRSQRTFSTSLVQDDSQETCETENIPAVLGPDVAKEATPQDLVKLPDSQYQDDCCGAEPSVVNLVPLNSSCDLKEAPEEVGIQPQGCIVGNKLDQALCDALLSGSCSRSQRTHSTALVQDDSQETCETENIPAVLGPDVAEEATPQDSVQLPDSQYQDDCCGAEPSVVNLVPLNGSCDLKEAPEEVGIQPQGCIVGNKLDQALCDALLSGSCSRSQRTHSTSLVQDDSQETCETENIPAVLGPPNVAEEAIPKDLVQLPDSQYQDDCCGAEPLVFNLVPLNSSCDLKEAHEEVVIQPQGCIDGNKLDQALCDALLSGSCSRSQRTHSTSLVQDDSQETCETENIPAVLGPDVAEEATPQDLVQLPDSQYQDDCCGAEPSVFNLVPLNSRCDLKDAPEELGIQPQGCIDGNKLDRAGENASEMRPDDGAFDPGGKSHLPPVPKPRLKASLPVNNDLAEHKPPHSKESSVALDLGFARPDRRDEPLDALPEGETPAVNPNVKEQSNNNNNHALTETCSGSLQHLSNEITAEGKEDSSVVPACLPQTDLQPAEADHQSAAAQLPPDQPLEFDPGGEDEQDEEVPDGVQSYESMRMPGSGSAGFQAQLNINMREMTDFKTPIVLDTGSGLMKAGFADQDLPNVIFPTIIGMPKYEEIMNGNFEKEIYIGHGAQHMRGVLALKHPIKNGIICNWDEMEKIWHHTFQQLGVDPEDHPVLLTEAAMNPSANRQRMVEIMFERFAVPFAYVAMQAVLALYAAGRSTGVVLDSGDGVSHSVPVFEGYSLSHAVQRFPLAGVDVTMHLKKLLQEQGVSMRSTAEMEIVREMKERCCCVAVNYEAELSQGGASCREMYYTMPDGQIVTLGTERFRAPEILFKPELIGRDHYGIHESVFKSILRSDIDLRRCLLGNIVLSGGNTLLPGFPERLQAEIKGLVPANMGDGVRVTSPKDRDFSVWSGGAVLANLPSFSAAWISQEEYDEHGPQIVFRKCF